MTISPYNLPSSSVNNIHTFNKLGVDEDLIVTLDFNKKVILIERIEFIEEIEDSGDGDWVSTYLPITSDIIEEIGTKFLFIVLGGIKSRDMHYYLEEFTNGLLGFLDGMLPIDNKDVFRLVGGVKHNEYVPAYIDHNNERYCRELRISSDAIFFKLDESVNYVTVLEKCNIESMHLNRISDRIHINLVDINEGDSSYTLSLLTALSL